MYLRTHFSQMPKKRANYANYAGCVGVTVSLTPVYISTYNRLCIRAYAPNVNTRMCTRSSLFAYASPRLI